MKKFCLSVLPTLISIVAWAQSNHDIINSTEVERIERTLSSDDMQGRKVFTPGIDRAADFIASEFKKAGLDPIERSGSYFQEFTMIKAKFLRAKGQFDGNELEQKNIIAFTSQPLLSFNEKSGFQKLRIAASDTFFKAASRYLFGDSGNYLIIVDTAHAKNFSRLLRFKSETFRNNANAVFVLSAIDPATYSIEVQHEIKEEKLKNIVGKIPGKSLKDEFVIFSAHYDHLGIGSPNADKDSIFNGANDDAAGTTAVISLANYFSSMRSNERTIIFAAFTGEESGGYGSRYFSKQLDPQKVMAMFNIEMIGTESMWGPNSAYITGYEKSDMGKILEKNLEGSPFKFYPDPYTKEQLFYRSDNATLARLGVPAHTISTSKMDAEPYYHTQKDEIQTLDLKNMTEIIKAIAISSTSIIAGKDTPSRVDVTQLR